MLIVELYAWSRVGKPVLTSNYDFQAYVSTSVYNAVLVASDPILIPQNYFLGLKLYWSWFNSYTLV